MYKLSRFESINGKPNREQIETWTENYFFNLLNTLNAFFAHVDVKEAASRMSAVPFDELVREQLEDESEEIIQIAVEKIKELAEIELEFIESYAE